MNEETMTMKSSCKRLRAAAALAMAIGFTSSCETTGDPGSGYTGYYANGYYDPWYYGGYYDDPDIIVRPPNNRPDAPARPSHPIASPPTATPYRGGAGGFGGGMGGGLGGGGMRGGGLGGRR